MKYRTGSIAGLQIYVYVDVALVTRTIGRTASTSAWLTIRLNVESVIPIGRNKWKLSEVSTYNVRLSTFRLSSTLHHSTVKSTSSIFAVKEEHNGIL
jgi:hypothetical protein